MLTVKNFLETKTVSWYQILSGGDLIETQEIEHISVSEYPVEDFVRKNEMVLSIGVGWEDEDVFLKFIQDLHAAKASALCFSCPENKLILPKKVLDYLSTENPFPFIILPWQCRYADILKVVLDLLRQDMVEAHDQYRSIQKRLLEAYLSNTPLNYAAQVLADAFGSKVAIFDANNSCKGFSRHFTPENQSILRSLCDEKDYMINIKTDERLYGSIYLRPLINENIVDQNLFLHYLSWPLALWFDKEWVIQISNQSMKDDFVWRLTKAKPDDINDLSKEGKRYGFYLGGIHTCIVGSIHFSGERTSEVKEQWIATNVAALKEEILQTAHVSGWHIMITYQQELLILYIQSQKSKENNNHVDRLLDILEKALADVFPQIYFTWGISEAGENPTDFCKCFQNAKMAQDLCPNIAMKNTRFTFKKTIVYNALSLLSSDLGIQEEVESVISPLYEYDRSMGTDLVKSLKCYLECKNLSETARLLYLHRHSLLYRINKIEELTGLSLKDADSFFLLELCIRMRNQ